MAMRKKGISRKVKIIGATATVLFSLFSLFTGTFAWFASNTTVTATGASVKVKAPEGINFDLYYLDHFAVDQSTNKDGNYNTTINAFSGYETAAANPVFEKILFDSEGVVVDNEGNALSNDENPTLINHLWPAHRLTYAIAITGGSLNSFNLDSWDEVTLPTVVTQIDDEEVEISLSWAIDIYGGAYYITDTGNVVNDLSTGFTSYLNDNSLTDKFTYSETNIAPVEKPSINLTNTISGESGDTKRVVLYFSIEFSNDDSTFYTFNNPYYVKDALGNSNCYENLSLTNLIFRLA